MPNPPPNETKSMQATGLEKKCHGRVKGYDLGLGFGVGVGQELLPPPPPSPPFHHFFCSLFLSFLLSSFLVLSDVLSIYGRT